MESYIINKFNELYETSKMSSKRAFTEQLLYILFARLIGLLDLKIRKDSKEEASFFDEDLFHLRWENLVAASPEEQFRLINGLPTRREQKEWKTRPWMNLFLFFRSDLKNTALREIASCFQDAEFRVNDCQVLSQMIQFVDELPIDGEFRDNFEDYLENFTGQGTFSRIKTTPNPYSKIMVELLDPYPQHSVCDPCCGSGKLLTRALGHSKAVDLGEYPLYYGYDSNPFCSEITAINMLLHGCNSIRCASKDTISKRADGDRKAFYSEFENTFDRVILQPPFGVPSSGEDMPECFAPFVKISGSDILFVALTEHILKTGGRGVVCLPGNFLFRSAYKAIRKRLVENNQLEAIVFLPSVDEFLLVFKKGKTTDKVLFYKLSDMSEDSIESFCTTWRAWKQRDDSTVDNFKSRSNNFFYVTKEDIVAQDYNLTFAKYHLVQWAEEDIQPLRDWVVQLKKKQEETQQLIDKINNLLSSIN